MLPAEATLFSAVPPDMSVNVPLAFLVTAVPVVPASVTLFLLIPPPAFASYCTAASAVALAASCTA